MDNEDKVRLERALEVSEENNRMLKTLIRAMRWGRFIKIIYWTLIIGTSIGFFYYFQPYLQGIKDAYGGFADTFRGVNSMFSPGN